MTAFPSSPKTLLTALSLMLGLTVTSLASVYYVSPTGSDTNPGTSTLPWKTIQKGVNTGLPGDSVLVQPGIYPERVATSRNGTPQARITIKTLGGVTNNGFSIRHSFVTVDGFQITGTPTAMYSGAIDIVKGITNVYVINNNIHDLTAGIYGLAFGYSQLADGGAQNCVVSNNIFRNLRYQMVNLMGVGHLVTHNLFDTSNGGDALRLFGRGSVIRLNRFTNISELPGSGNHPDIFQTFGDEGTEAYDMLFERNLIQDSVCQVCQLEQKGVANIRDWTIRNNLFLNVAWAANIDMVGTKWYNNVFYRCTQTTGHVLFFNKVTKGEAWGSQVFNNVFLECGTDPANRAMGWYWVDPLLTDFSADYNYVAGTGFAAKTSGLTRSTWVYSEAHGLNGGDPGFASIADRDFRLLQRSKLMDAGTGVPGVLEDFDGTVRPQGIAIDVGAFEGSGSAAAEAGLAAPGNLRRIAP